MVVGEELPVAGNSRENFAGVRFSGIAFGTLA